MSTSERSQGDAKKPSSPPRYLALQALRAVQRGAFADAALDRVLRQSALSSQDRRLLTELVYGTVRRQRTLDALIDQLARRKAEQQHLDLRLILHLGLYQLRYLSQIPASAAVDTSVELARQARLGGLTGFVNGLLRQYVRLAAKTSEPLNLPEDPVVRLGVLHSYPDWIIRVWNAQLGPVETEQLCERLNQVPHLDLRINPLKTTCADVVMALQETGVTARPVPHLPQALRLGGTDEDSASQGPITLVPGFDQGWWMVQDSSAQLVAHLLDPQPGETVIDACAAPGGKSAHIAELMDDRGTVWACDRVEARLDKVERNARRLGLQAVRPCLGDSRDFPQFVGSADRVLLDAPCSGLGTLNRHADARWRQTPESIAELTILQGELLQQAALWVKPEGVLVYATCTLHPDENELLVRRFQALHPEWQIEPPAAGTPAAPFATTEGWVKVWPHQHPMDGFFMVRLRRRAIHD